MYKDDETPTVTAVPTSSERVRVDKSGLSLTETRYLVQVKSTLDRLSKADPKNVQEVAASQLDLMSVYYHEVLDQARRSFRSASVVAIVGFAFFLLAIVLFLLQQAQNVVALSAVSGGIIEIISAVNFYLYRKASAQMADFHARLDITQRFLLANSICEGLQGEAKQKGRLDLVQAIIGTQPAIESKLRERSAQVEDS